MTPDELCKSGKEHGNQAALFCWSACAAQFGFEYASDDFAYNLVTRNSLSWKPGFGQPYPVPVLSRLHVIHNQGHGDAIRGARAKAEGVKAGVPDIFLPVPRLENGGAWFAGLYIELKQEKYRTHKDGGVSEKQSEWIDYLRGAGYCVEVAYGWREAAQAITKYLKH